MPITESVIQQVAEWALKDQAMSGLMFMDKYRVEFKFFEEEDAIIVEKNIEEAPFPDIPVEAPDMLTQHENLVNGKDIVEEEPTSEDEERAMLVAEHSGMELNSMVRTCLGKVIKILDNDKDDQITEKHIEEDIT